MFGHEVHLLSSVSWWVSKNSDYTGAPVFLLSLRLCEFGNLEQSSPGRPRKTFTGPEYTILRWQDQRHGARKLAAKMLGEEQRGHIFMEQRDQEVELRQAGLQLSAGHKTQQVSWATIRRGHTCRNCSEYINTQDK